MPLQHFLWNDPRPIPDFVTKNLECYSEPFQSILFQRGITTSEDAINFLLPKEQDWHSAIQLRQIGTACQIISDAVENQDLITVYGDYDADGITSTALLTLTLRKIGGKVIPYLPNRFSSGYGLNIQAINELHNLGVKLLITADNGIRSDIEISHAKSLGMSVVVTDHHEPGNYLPDADALINPKLPDDNYPNKQLAGVGVIYKLVCALQDLYPIINPHDYLDLVAIGTVADVVPLTGENRYLVRQGLTVLNKLQRQGLVSLIGAANLNNRKITSADISFQIAPRINSSGRLEVDRPDIPLKLLLSSKPGESGSLSQELEIHNTRRKLLSRDLQIRINSEILKLAPTTSLIMSFDKNNHLGVAGIAAGYLARKYYSPVIVGQIGCEETIASCRSIPEFNMISALNQCKDMFIRYGGHKMAAGFTIHNQKLAELRKRLESITMDRLSGLDLHPKLDIDAEISLNSINNSLYKELEKLEPTGSRNRQALFLTRNLIATNKSRVGKNLDHMKLTVSDGNNHFDAIGFGFGETSETMAEEFDLVYALTINNYRGKRSFQLQIHDLRKS